MKNTTVGIYLRVSSGTQNHRSQLIDLEKWAKAQDCEAKWYKDTASGSDTSRPALDKLMADVQRGEISKIVIWRLDRLGRSTAGLAQMFDDLIARGIGLFSLKDSLDLETAAGKLMCRVLASIAEFEKEIRQERQSAGIRAARLAGRKWGGSRRGRRISVVDEQVAIAKRLRSEGMNISAISRAVNLSRPTIYRLLREAS